MTSFTLENRVTWDRFGGQEGGPTSEWTGEHTEDRQGDPAGAVWRSRMAMAHRACDSANESFTISLFWGALNIRRLPYGWRTSPHTSSVVDTCRQTEISIEHRIAP